MKRKKRGMRPLEYDYEAAYQNSIEMLDEYFLEQIAKQNRKGLYACKEIYSGGQLEIELYPEFFRKEDIPEAGRKKRNKKAQDNLNDKNARKYLERLINANFHTSDIWATLVYRSGQEPQSMEEAMRNMRNYISARPMIAVTDFRGMRICSGVTVSPRRFCASSSCKISGWSARGRSP